MAVKEVKLLYKELRELRAILERVGALLEERLIGVEEPLLDEIEAIREYGNDKKKGKVELVKLGDILGKENDKT